jgi:hypothetical protein
MSNPIFNQRVRSMGPAPEQSTHKLQVHAFAADLPSIRRNPHRHSRHCCASRRDSRNGQCPSYFWTVRKTSLLLGFPGCGEFLIRICSDDICAGQSLSVNESMLCRVGSLHASKSTLGHRETACMYRLVSECGDCRVQPRGLPWRISIVRKLVLILQKCRIRVGTILCLIVSAWEHVVMVVTGMPDA